MQDSEAKTTEMHAPLGTVCRTALVLDWPSIDAAEGSPLSAWEASVTKELAQAAGFKPEKLFLSYPRHVRKWSDLFVGGKTYGLRSAPA